MKYEEFLKGKEIVDNFSGFDPGRLNGRLFDFQTDIVRWGFPANDNSVARLPE